MRPVSNPYKDANPSGRHRERLAAYDDERRAAAGLGQALLLPVPRQAPLPGCGRGGTHLARPADQHDHVGEGEADAEQHDDAVHDVRVDDGQHARQHRVEHREHGHEHHPHLLNITACLSASWLRVG